MSLVLVSLASCVSTGSGKVVITSNPPKKVIDSKIKELCNLPIILPERTLTKDEEEKYWGKDRKNLVECYNKHKARIELDGVKNG